MMPGFNETQWSGVLMPRENHHKSDPGSFHVDDYGKATTDVVSISNQPPQRKYLPTFSDLVDRLCIVQLKMIFLSEFRAEYLAERDLILHDIDLILQASPPVTAKAIMAITILQLSNRCIWESESKARAGGNEQDQLLKMTHSINGVRNTAKNILAGELGGRKDYKIDALAADLPPEYGHWRVFE